MSKTIDPIPFARPFIGAEEEEAVLRVLQSGWLTTGKEALSFEKEFASFFKKRNSGTLEDQNEINALAVNSATSGLHLALEACGVGPGDIVVTSTYTFTATAEVVRYLGAHVVFVDVKAGTYLMDPNALEMVLERLSQGLPAYAPRPGSHDPAKGFGPVGKVKAIIPVHVAGLACDMDTIVHLARTYGAMVIEDAAHSFPSRLADGRWVGLLGDIGVFSFYATKTITTGEGGMVITYNKDMANRISVMRSHGIDRSIWNRYTDTKASWKYAVVAPGYKYNMPDLLAAIGRVQLGRALDLLEMRRHIAERYNQAFSCISELLVPPSGIENAWHLYPLRLADEPNASTRDRFIELLQSRGIGISVHFIPLHTMPYYADLYHFSEADFPNAIDTFKRSVSLPIWPGMTEEQIDRVIETVIKTIQELKG